MFTFNPSEVPATKSSMEFVASLLAVLRDPQATEHLAQMQAKLEEIAQADADLRAKTAQGEAAHEHAAEALFEREQALEKRETALADVRQAEAAAESRRAAAAEAEARADEATHALIERETAVQQLEMAVAQRQRELDTRSASLDARAAALSAQEADYQQRMGKLKALMPV